MYSQAPPPKYPLGTHQYGGPPPAYYQPCPQKPPPRYEDHRSSGCCMRFICCCCSFLFTLLITFVITVALIYALYQPKMPIYKLEDFTVNAFDVFPDTTIAADIIVKIRAENPNDKIGFIYGKDSLVSVTFEDFGLCEGTIPSFYQGHGNVSLVNVRMIGKTSLGSELSDKLMSHERQQMIPLVVVVRVPMVVVLDSFPLRQVYVRVHCELVVDGLKPEKKPKILSVKYKFGFGH